MFSNTHFLFLTYFNRVGGSGKDVRSKARVQKETIIIIMCVLCFDKLKILVVFVCVKTISGPVTDASKLPKWNYDGSSTGQAPGQDSEVIL